MNRRKFLSLMSAAGIAATVSPATGNAASTASFNGSPEAVGVLHDSTRCIGCRKCEAGCQQVNDKSNKNITTGMYLPKPGEYKNPGDRKPFDDLSVLEKKRRTDFQRYTVVNKYTPEGAKSPVFRKQQCNHCMEPACASACFVKAFVKTPEGPVVYNPDVCVGCRYCMVACPFDVPKYDYNNPFGALHKCELCNQKDVARLDNGELPGCVEVCPAGAVIFGTREELLEEARKRLAMKPGSEYRYPRQTLNTNDTYVHNVPSYYPHLYGEKEGGGTQVLVLTGVPYQQLGLPELDDLATGARSEHVQHTVYKGMMLPLAVLVGLTALVRRNTRDKHDGGDHES